MQRQGSLGAGGGRKEEESKGYEGGVKGWMKLWKEQRWIQELIRGKSEKSTSLTHQVHDIYSLALLLCSSAACVTLFPFQQTECTPREKSEHWPKLWTKKEIQ